MNKRYGFVVLAVMLGACGRTEDTVMSGTWGGANVQLRVSGEATSVGFYCAKGTLAGPLTLRSGRFSVDGTYTEFRHVPIAGRTEVVDGPTRGATYSGEVHGLDMTLSVSVEGGETAKYRLYHDHVGTFLAGLCIG